jgi:hypothetical protein
MSPELGKTRTEQIGKDIDTLVAGLHHGLDNFRSIRSQIAECEQQRPDGPGERRATATREG